MRKFFNLLKDVLVTDLVFVLPFIIKWYYRRLITHEIVPLGLNNSRSAILYMHGSHQGTTPVLLLHGLYGHPFTFLHVADSLQKAKIGPIFSLRLFYNEHFPHVHRALLKQALDEIEKMMKENSKDFKKIIVVGHSMGAIEGAYSAFVDEDKRLLALVSIAGRLKVVPCLHKECPEHLKATIEKIYQGIKKNTEFPLYQIAGRQDWNAPIEATAVRTDDSCCHIIDDAMHFNVLYNPETKQKLLEFIQHLIRAQ